MTSSYLRKCIFVTTVIVASLWLLWFFDDGLGVGWPANTLRNWQQYGVVPLHGALVFNSGGFEALTAPQIYPGMSPYFMYLIYFSTILLGWTGLGTTAFFLILALLVFWGIWSLIGKNSFALLMAAVIILSPGYGRWLAGVDPNAVSVLLGIPYAALILSRLKKDRLQGADIGIMVLLTAAFVPLNWTTAWVLAPFGVFLLVSSQVRRMTVIKFLTLAAAGSMLFVGLSVHSKSGAMMPGRPGETFLGGYMWGNYGYGEGLTTSRAFVRIFFITSISLLPVFLIWVGMVFRRPRAAAHSLFVVILPLAMVLLEVATMRNYFGHHPWMTPPVVIVGLVFTIVLSLESVPKSDHAPQAGMKCQMFTAAACLVYGLAVVVFYRFNGGDGRELIGFVRHETARTDWVVVVKSLDPTTAEIAARLGDVLDRHIVAVDDLKSLPTGQPFAILTMVPMNEGRLIAKQDAGSGAGMDAVLQKAADWFNQTIAHRNPGDRIDFPRHCYLYRMTP